MTLRLRDLSLFLVLAGSATLFYTCSAVKKPSAVGYTQPHAPAYLSARNSMRSIQLPKGYHLQLVASEPMIQAPVALVWDGNGAMYVAEANSVSQDKETPGLERTCQIKRLEDTNDDGVMDKQTVFIDSLVFPGMMLCLGKQLLVNESLTNDVWGYTDGDGDGIAESKILVYKGGNPDTGSFAFPCSGFTWNMDNHIYAAGNAVRFRYVNNMLEADSVFHRPGQSGVANDNYGRLFFSYANGAIPAGGFQVNPVYASLETGRQFVDDFQSVWPPATTNKTQREKPRVQTASAPTHFVSAAGLSIFRGDRLPADLQGDLLICEPAQGLVRRAKVINENGEIRLKHAYEKKEFLASADMNFAPVFTATGPDGCLYIVDMNRAFIQGSDSLTKHRLSMNVKTLPSGSAPGRIYRLVHDAFKRGTRPHLLNDPTAELVNYLGHPNGWWRENAQKEIIVRADKSVIPALKELARAGVSNKTTSPLARIHALWTLDGMGATDKDILLQALTDQDYQVRKMAAWISEAFARNNDKQVLEKLAGLVNDPSMDVRIQLLLSLHGIESAEGRAIVKELLKPQQHNNFIAEVQNSLELKDNIRLYGSKLALMPAADRKLILQGRKIFVQICSGCHGPEGKSFASSGGMGAPPFVNSKRVSGESSILVKILLDGLIGPIDGKNYPDYMPPFGAANDDEWVASILSYIRNDFGNLPSPVVQVEEVKKIRSESAGRASMWTLKELTKEKN